ncbi:MAG: hypothetical protein ACRCYZ_06800 [Alphaproteobacteria bacterium]
MIARACVRLMLDLAAALLRAASCWWRLEAADRSSLRWYATRASLIGRYSHWSIPADRVVADVCTLCGSREHGRSGCPWTRETAMKRAARRR